MQNELIITNGDSAVNIMRAAGFDGDIIAWRDVLHDGPVPADMSLRELSRVRARFIAERGWGRLPDVRADFTRRDNSLASYANYEKVVLWFEHDLYDQLQILQILDWFSQLDVIETNLFMVCTENYLGMQSPEQMRQLKAYEQVITNEQLDLASQAWLAFRQSEPLAFQKILRQDTSALPFLADAIVRQLEEYPSCVNGLSRTAQKALEVIAGGESKPGRVFGAYIATEERKFLGDSSFWIILQNLLNSSPPLIALSSGQRLTLPTSPMQRLHITEDGLKVLAAEANFLDMVEIDLWIGGVHLTPDDVWCWNAEEQSVTKLT